MNKLDAKYYFRNGDVVDCISYHVTTKISLIDLLLEAREDPDFVSLHIGKK